MTGPPAPARAPGLAALLAALLLAGGGLAAAPAPTAAPSARPARPALPRIVFVARAPLPGLPEAIPGLGPAFRAAGAGGRLLVREPGGAVRPLLRAGALHDVSDPAVSWDGRRVAFAARAAPDSAWRIYVAGADGRGLRAVTRTDRSLDLASLGAAAERFERYDDLDPVWLPDGRLCFASTRFPLEAQPGPAATQLFVVNADGGDLHRITAERNGAEEPTVDPVTGRVVYARWFFNRMRALDEPPGLTTDPARAVPADLVDLWHAISILPDGDGMRLAGGDARVRSGQMAYQPALLADGTLIGVGAERPPLVPAPGATFLQAFPRGFAAARRLTGTGRSAGALACAPAALGPGRIVFSMRPAGAADFGLWTVRADGSGLARLLDLPGTHELDAAVLAPRRRPPSLPRGQTEPMPALPRTSLAQLQDAIHTFRFDCLNVFANAPVDAPFPDAIPIQGGVRIRFFAALSRPGAAGGDTVVLVNEIPVQPTGAVHIEDMPADTPLFEQLVDGHGRLLRSASGPAHVPGYNFDRFGSGTKCVGCHSGHSALFVPASKYLGEWTNVAPSAEVTASSSLAGSRGPRAAVDRRAAGPPDSVAWLTENLQDPWLRLTWTGPIEINRIVLHACASEGAHGAVCRIAETELVFFRSGREVRRATLKQPILPGGSRLDLDPVLADALEVHPLRVDGSARPRPRLGIAEVETIARIVAE